MDEFVNEVYLKNVKTIFPDFDASNRPPFLLRFQIVDIYENNVVVNLSRMYYDAKTLGGWNFPRLLNTCMQLRV